jgi:hypothetical protein
MENYYVIPLQLKLIDASTNIQLRAFTAHYAVVISAFLRTASLPEMWLGHSDAETHSCPLEYDYMQVSWNKPLFRRNVIFLFW